jgi:nucleoside kinase
VTPEAPSRPRDLLVSGHVNVDRFLALPRFPASDRTVPVLAHRVVLGGTAGNIALAASRYGVASGLVARVGDGFPEAFRERLRQAHIDLRGLEKTPGEPTPTAYILEDPEGGQRTLMDQGAMRDRKGRATPRPWLEEYSWVHLTTGPPDLQLALLDEGRARGLRAAADPAQEIHYRWDPPRLRQLLRGCEILFGNRSEVAKAAQLLGVRAPEGLLGHVPLVVRTEGTAGATAFSRTGSVHVAAVRPKRARTFVGAGDCFRGGFYAGWFEGEPMKGCLAAGARAAARGIEEAG